MSTFEPFFSIKKGYGLRATRKIEVGELILEEEPLLLAQSIGNEKLCKVCSHCLKFVGNVTEQFLKLLVANEESKQQQDIENFTKLFGEHVPVENPELPLGTECDNQCGTIYCSESCKKNAFNNYHKLLCSKPSSSQLIALHASIQHYKLDNFVLLEKIYAFLSVDFDANKKIIDSFCLKKWSEIATDTRKASKIIEELWKSFKSAIIEDNKLNVGEFATKEKFDELLGMLQLNMTSIKVANPLSTYFYNLRNSDLSKYQCLLCH